MVVVVNGTPRRVPPGTTITVLLSELGHASDRVAVEHNHDVVPRARHATTTLSPGDRIEIVAFVGGG
jgi:thiamine biosynthesis protein ThiS